MSADEKNKINNFGILFDGIINTCSGLIDIINGTSDNKNYLNTAKACGKAKQSGIAFKAGFSDEKVSKRAKKTRGESVDPLTLGNVT